MINKILLLIASIFLIWQSIDLIINIDNFIINSWWSIFLSSFFINLFITGIFAFSGFAFPTQKLLPNSYYQIQDPKKLKKIYEAFQVHMFRRILLATIWKSKKQRKKYFNGTENGIPNLEEQSRKSEFGLLIPFIIISFVAIYLFIIGLIKIGLI